MFFNMWAAPNWVMVFSLYMLFFFPNYGLRCSVALLVSYMVLGFRLVEPLHVTLIPIRAALPQPMDVNQKELTLFHLTPRNLKSFHIVISFPQKLSHTLCICH